MPIKSYVKVFGPSLLDAIKALEEIELGEEVPARSIGFTLGEYDFCFEWIRGQPNTAQFYKLIEKIDKALSPLGVQYTKQTFVRL